MVDKSVPRNTPVNRPLVGAMIAQGILTSLEVAGTIDGDAFCVTAKQARGWFQHAGYGLAGVQRQPATSDSLPQKSTQMERAPDVPTACVHYSAGFSP